MWESIDKPIPISALGSNFVPFESPATTSQTISIHTFSVSAPVWREFPWQVPSFLIVWDGEVVIVEWEVETGMKYEITFVFDVSTDHMPVLHRFGAINVHILL